MALEGVRGDFAAAEEAALKDPTEAVAQPPAHLPKVSLSPPGLQAAAVSFVIPPDQDGA